MQSERGVGRGRVLTVDDDRLVRTLVACYLGAQGYVVDAVEDGAAALRRLARAEYDVVITDLHMPDLSGFQLLSAIKDFAPETEVILLTGAHAAQSAREAMRLGAHEYITKPVTNPACVVPAVDRALARRRREAVNERMLRELDALR